MATELTNFYQGKLDDYATLVDNTTARLADTAVELKDINEQADALVNDIGVLDKTIAQLRAAMSGPNLTPADIEGLAETLREELINRRKKYAELIEVRIRKNNAELRRGRDRTLLKSYKDSLAQCALEADDANRRGVKHANWLSTDTETTITEQVDMSQTLLAEVSGTPEPPADPDSVETANRALIAAADARVDADIPEILRDRARSRATTLVDDYAALLTTQLSTTEDENAAYAVAHYGDSGEVLQQWLTYKRVESSLGKVATATAAKVDQALGLLRSVRDTAPLTTAESERITEVELAADDEALVTEAQLDTAIAAVSAKDVELELAILAAIIDDPVADPAANSAVQTLQTELDNLNTALDNARAAHTTAMAESLDAWEVAVPNPIWAALKNYDAAIALLSDVANTDLAATTTAFSNTETSLVTALEAANANKQVQAYLSAALTAARLQNDFAVDSHASNFSSALRGDA